MLLLLRSAPSGVAAASLGINLGLSGIAGPVASLGLSLDLTPPNSVELNVTATPDIHFGISAISSGFLSRTASVDITHGLTAAAAFIDTPTVGIVFGLSGTVGSFLQNSATFAITFGVTGQVSAAPTAVLNTVLGLSGAPIISGGTITPTASVAMALGIATPTAVFAANGACSINFTLTATGLQLGRAANLPTGPYISGIGVWDITIRTYA